MPGTGDITARLHELETTLGELPAAEVPLALAPVTLETRFVAVVDGSDGDTYLQQVDARILDTPLTASGGMAGCCRTCPPRIWPGTWTRSG